MNNRLSLLLLLIVLSVSACKKHVPGKSATITEAETINKVTVRNVDNFQFFTAKGRVQLETNKMNLSSAINIRMQKDSVIWISLVPALGIEAVRAKFTPDSFQIIDRINRNYYSGDYAYVQQKFNVNVTYSMLQAILLGNFEPGDLAQQQILAYSPVQHVRQTARNLVMDTYIDTENFKVRKKEVRDIATDNQLSVNYNDFLPLETILFPFSALVVIHPEGTEENNTTLSIKYNKVSVTEPALDFPFTIPEGYQKR